MLGNRVNLIAQAHDSSKSLRSGTRLMGSANTQELGNDPLGILRPPSKLAHALPLASAYGAAGADAEAAAAAQGGDPRHRRRAADPKHHHEPKVRDQRGCRVLEEFSRSLRSMGVCRAVRGAASAARGGAVVRAGPSRDASEAGARTIPPVVLCSPAPALCGRLSRAGCACALASCWGTLVRGLPH